MAMLLKRCDVISTFEKDEKKEEAEMMYDFEDSILSLSLFLAPPLSRSLSPNLIKNTRTAHTQSRHTHHTLYHHSHQMQMSQSFWSLSPCYVSETTDLPKNKRHIYFVVR